MAQGFNDLWIYRSTAISFPPGISWAADGYFKVVCESGVTSGAVPIPIGALPFLLESASIAFKEIKATGENSSAVRSYFTGIDATARELGEDSGSPRTITFNDKGNPVTGKLLALAILNIAPSSHRG